MQKIQKTQADNNIIMQQQKQSTKNLPAEFINIIKNQPSVKWLLLFLVICLGIFVFGSDSFRSTLDLDSLMEVSLALRRNTTANTIDVNGYQDFTMYDLPLSSTLKKYEMRRRLSQPKVSHSYFRIWTIEKKSAQKTPQSKTPFQNCAIINAYNLVEASTILTALTLLNSTTISKVLLLTRDHDPYSFNLIGRIPNEIYLVGNEKAVVDSEYRFITKHTNKYNKVIYLQGSHGIHSNLLQSFEQQMIENDNFALMHSSKARVRGTIENLRPLNQMNLEQIQVWQLYNHVFVFNASLLISITPLNFAYYAKYNFQEIIIWPILALLQQTFQIGQFKGLVHSYNFTSASNAEFAIKSPAKQNSAMCFVSYPSDPFRVQYSQLQSYLQSLQSMYKENMNISIVLHLPYNFSQSLETIKLLQTMQKLRKSNTFSRIRLRIRANKTVSTLAAYESVYQYCPNQSLIVTSRHNVRFHQDFAVEILKNLNQKYHYLHTGFIMEDQGEVLFNQLPAYNQSFKARRSDLFERYFRHFQIYKSDFLKTNVFWVLKNEEIDFYETESPLVILMMEETRLEFEYINKTLVTVYKRAESKLQMQQIKNVKSYAEYSKLINNQLMPYKYNCLQNPAYRRNAPDLIQRNIHQIWISDQPIPKLRMVLHQTIKDKNPNFDVKLWRAHNITKENFPATYHIVQRAFQHHKDSNRSFFTLAADVLRYELIYKYGGIYVDFKMEGKKPLDKFLKYQVFYLDCDIEYIRFDNPQAIGIGVMGSMQNSYHMKKLLYQIIFEQNIKFTLEIPKQTGGYNGRKSFTDEEFFTLLGLGYQLLFPLPYQKIVNACGGEDKQFDSDQTVYEIIDVESQKLIKIGLPCRQYPQAYLISYSPLAKTWLSSQSAQLEALNRIKSIHYKNPN